MRPQWTTIDHYVVFDDEGEGGFPALIDSEHGDYRWHEGAERHPCMLCYTSGTTGNPKGVLYTHRSSLIHAISGIQPALLNFSPRARVLPVGSDKKPALLVYGYAERKELKAFSSGRHIFNVTCSMVVRVLTDMPPKISEMPLPTSKRPQVVLIVDFDW